MPGTAGIAAGPARPEHELARTEGRKAAASARQPRTRRTGRRAGEIRAGLRRRQFLRASICAPDGRRQAPKRGEPISPPEACRPSGWTGIAACTSRDGCAATGRPDSSASASTTSRRRFVAPRDTNRPDSPRCPPSVERVGVLADRPLPHAEDGCRPPRFPALHRHGAHVRTLRPAPSPGSPARWIAVRAASGPRRSPQRHSHRPGGGTIRRTVPEPALLRRLTEAQTGRAGSSRVHRLTGCPSARHSWSGPLTERAGGQRAQARIRSPALPAALSRHPAAGAPEPKPRGRETGAPMKPA